MRSLFREVFAMCMNSFVLDFILSVGIDRESGSSIVLFYISDFILSAPSWNLGIEIGLSTISYFTC